MSATMGSLSGRPIYYRPLKPPNPTYSQQVELSAIRTSDGKVHPIEPLTGMGRHPLATPLCGYTGVDAAASVFNLSYLILANMCDHVGEWAGLDPLGAVREP